MAPPQVPVYDEMKKRDAEPRARLEQAGFMLDFGVDGSGLFMRYLRRSPGYCADLGASERVAGGGTRFGSGVDIQRINAKCVTPTDGTELPAELIVYVTGCGSTNGWLADLISPEVADQVGKVLDLGSDMSTKWRRGTAFQRCLRHFAKYLPPAVQAALTTGLARQT